MAKEIQWIPEIVPNGGIDETRSPTQIADNAWTAGSNVEPLPDGVRTRQGTSISNTVIKGGPLQAINLEEDSGTDDLEIYSGNSEYLAQQFTVGASDIEVDTFAVRLKVFAGDPSSAGDIDGAIYADDGGDQPNSFDVVQPFANCTDIADGDVTSEYVWYRFVFSSAVTLDAATKYHLVIFQNTAQGTGTHTFSAECDLTGNPFAGGQANRSTNGVSFTALANTDLNFRVYAGSGAITGIHDYWLSDGVTQRHLVAHDREVYKNVAGTMTPVSNRARVGFTSDADEFTDFAVANDICMIANGTDTPASFYVDSGVEYWQNQGISAPTATLTLNPAAAGSVVDGTYQVDYFYWNDDTGQPSNRRYQGVSATTVTTAAGNNTIAITGIPADVAREGDRATHIRFELLEQGTDTVFTLALDSNGDPWQVALGTTSLNITTHVKGAQAEYTHNLPATHSINAVAENRQFTNDTDSPWRVNFSKISGTSAFYESFPANNFRDFGKGDADYVTALLFIRPRTIIVGMKNSVWALDARRPGTSDRLQIAKGIGIAHHNAAVVVGRTLYFISDGDRSKGPFVWRGTGEPQPVIGLDDTFKNLNQARIKYASCIHYAPDQNRFQWWTLLTSSGLSSPDRVLMYDYALNSWAVYKITANVLGMVDVNSVTRVFAGGVDGFERQADSGTQDDTTDIESSYDMKAFDFGSQEILKKMRWIDYVALAKTEGSINLSMQYDFGARNDATATLPHIGSANTWVWGTSVWGAGAVWGSSVQNIVGRVSVGGFGKFVQPKLNASKPFHIKSLSLGVQPTGRRG